MCIGVSLTTPQYYTQYYTPYYTQYYNTNPPHRRTRKEAKQTPSHMQPTHILADVRSSRSSHTNQSHDIHPLLLNTASLSALAFLFILSTLPLRNLNQHAGAFSHSLFGLNVLFIIFLVCVEPVLVLCRRVYDFYTEAVMTTLLSASLCRDTMSKTFHLAISHEYKHPLHTLCNNLNVLRMLCSMIMNCNAVPPPQLPDPHLYLTSRRVCCKCQGSSW